MIRAFVFVTTRSLRNRILSRLARLRQPRYLLSLVAALVYMWFAFGRHMGKSEALGGFVIPPTDLGADIASLVVLAMMILVWALPEDAGGLTFSEAEIQFLFTAPLTRRQIVLYKIWRQQPQVFFSAILFTFFGLRSSRFIGVWICLVALSIFFTMSSLARARMKVAGINFFLRLPVVLAVAVGIGFAFWREVKRLPAKEAASAVLRSDMPQLLGYADSIFDSVFAQIILFIPRLFGRAILPANTTQLIISCTGVAILAFVFLRIAERLNVSFEEGSIKASARTIARKAEVHAQRIGRNVMFPRLPPPFPLPPAPSVELAILWKNATAAMRMSALWVALIAFAFAVFMAGAVMANDVHLKVATVTMAMVVCAFFPFFGTQVFGQDMRLDLSRIEVLKSYPIEGDRLVAAEIAAPLAIVAVLEMIMLTVVAVFVRALPDKGPLGFVATPEFITIVLLVTIPITGLMLLIRNAVPILLPGWASRSSEEPRGFVVMGQRIVELLVIVLALGLALVPPALIVLPALYISRHYSAPFVLAVGTAPAALVLFFELWLGIRFLGAQFEKIDVSNEIDAVG